MHFTFIHKTICFSWVHLSAWKRLSGEYIILEKCDYTINSSALHHTTDYCMTKKMEQNYIIISMLKILIAKQN